MSTAGQADGGGNPNPGANGATPPPGTPPAGGTPGDWFSGFKNTELKGYVQNKGFKDPESVSEAYYHLEKLTGVPPEKIIKLPEAMDDKTMMPIFDKLGRPEKPEGYVLPTPEGGKADDNFVKFAQGAFHEIGVTKGQGEKLAAKWNEYVAAQNKAYTEEHNTKVKTEHDALVKEWGAAYKQNVEIGRNAIQSFGVSKEQMDALESVLGFAGLFKFAHNLGTKLGEDKFVGSGKGEGGGFGVMTPAQAQARLTQLKQDQEYVKRYTAGETAVVNEMESLHKLAFPESAT